MSDIEGKAARVAARERNCGDASDIDGQTDRSNGAYGKSDIEGKTAREAASELGKERVSNGRKHMIQLGNDRVSMGTQIQDFPAFLSDHLPLFRVSSNSKCVFVLSGFSVSHFSLR